jgi:hypothetical protein
VGRPFSSTFDHDRNNLQQTRSAIALRAGSHEDESIVPADLVDIITRLVEYSGMKMEQEDIKRGIKRMDNEDVRQELRGLNVHSFQHSDDIRAKLYKDYGVNMTKAQSFLILDLDQFIGFPVHGRHRCANIWEIEL